MDAIVERCCGLDVHQATVVACFLVGRADAKPRKEVRTFGTMTRDLLALRDWLHAAGCTHVGMESTAVYWKPLYALLEDTFTVIVGNAHHIKQRAGPQDGREGQRMDRRPRPPWPHPPELRAPKPLRELRDLLRYRRKLVESRSAERNRLLKLLETANIKLSSVASNVFGVSGMRMLTALVAGTATPDEMAALARGVLRKKIPDLERALEGRMEEHHRFLLQLQLCRLEQVDDALTPLDHRIDQQLAAYRDVHTRLTQIPGVDRIGAAVLVAEIGTDMRVFHSPAHLAAWAGVAPGNHETGGKRQHAKVRRGNVHLQSTLFEAAKGAAKTKGSYLKDKYHRLKARRGAQRATMAIAHKILIAAYHMLATGTDYADLGAAYLDQLDNTRVTANLVRRLERLGYQVDLRKAA